MTENPENAVNLVAGIHAVTAILKAGPKRVQKLLCPHTVRNKRLVALLNLAANQGVVVERVERNVLDSLCGHSKHQSIVAYYAGEPTRSESNLLTDLQSQARPWLLLLLDEVQDPHNLGACLRSADGFGAHAVVIPKANSAPLNAAAQKSAAGAAASVPLYRVSNLVRVMRQLQQAGVWVFGADADSNLALFDVDFTESVALVLGAEGSGLRKLTREACDQLYKIPLSGRVSSLNVSVAAGISLAEAIRQRI